MSVLRHSRALNNCLSIYLILSSFFFQNEEIFVQLDELDKLDRITHDQIKVSHKYRNYSSAIVRVADS